MTPEEAVADALWDLTLEAHDVAWFRPRRLGVAVSGGGDSMALLHLLAACARDTRDKQPFELCAVTVDHGLRPDSAEEAAFAARACAALGVPHDTLRWEGPGRGNLQEAARDARRRLIGAWGEELGLMDVCLGHTADDQAETVLLRLARGSGVDGLAGMEGVAADDRVVWRRPLLGLGRAALRDWLRERGVAWVEDPSNADPRFDRARARAMADALADLGLTQGRLVRTAGHMARARRTLIAEAARRAAEQVRQEDRDLLLARSLLWEMEHEDTAGRLLSAALMWVGGRTTRPRYDALLRLAVLARAGRPATLGGCLARPEGEWLRLSREARAVGPPAAMSFAAFLRGAP